MGCCDLRRHGFALVVLLVLSGAGADAENWPAFRGATAGGVGHGRTPTTWDVARSVNVAWKTPVPGVAISSPIIWEDRIYLTTAVPLARPRGNDFRTPHAWKLLSLDRVSGKVIWERTAHEGVPYMQRHPHSSYANATPATDGRHIVALFATDALACFDANGRLLWKKLLQVNSKRDAFHSGSSPIIVEDLAILQDDRDRDSYIAAYRLRDGSEAWRVSRDDGPSQSTPVAWTAGRNAKPLLIVAAEQSIRALEARTGKPVWSFVTKAVIPLATPALAGDVVISSAGDDLLAVRASSSGEVSLASGRTESAGVIWSVEHGGGHIPSPVVLGDNVFVLGNSGVLTAYDVHSGRQVSRQRAGTGEFCTSPVSADGKIYVFNREGEATVLRAAPTLDVIARNQMGEATLATPALVDGTLYVRTAGHLIALRESARPPPRTFLMSFELAHVMPGPSGASHMFI